MTRAPELAPSWLPRRQRRAVDRQLHKLFQRGVCSICSSPFKHNSCTASGFDAHGKVVLAGECCLDRVAQIFALGLELTGEHIAAIQQKAAIDKILHVCGGVSGAPKVNLHEQPWKTDDSLWFKQNPTRSHRVRMPFPGEADKEAAETPAGQVLLMLTQQVEPGVRIRAAVTLDVGFLPLPDDEATAHALFEVAMEREAVPPDRRTLCALAEKYKGRQGQ
jgi:hypothetical protein